jgi:hypothetical protein
MGGYPLYGFLRATMLKDVSRNLNILRYPLYGFLRDLNILRYSVYGFLRATMLKDVLEML